MFHRDTIVVGSKHIEAHIGGDGRKIPAQWEHGKISDQAVHWRSAGAKRENNGVKESAAPRALSVVNVFRGMGCRHANEVRHDIIRRRAGEERPWKHGVR